MILQLEWAWQQLLQTFAIEQTEAQHALASLVRAYASPGRVYHTLDHVRAVLQWTLQLRHEAHNLPAIQLAAWFHDSIYDPRASDNEEQSALYATSVLSSLGMAHTTVHVVAHMIVCTKTHMADESEKDCLILLDADLAILGTNASDYDAYARAIRQEYHWVCEASYRLARARILQTLLERPRIYRTETLHVAQEKQARENLIREIGLLTRNP